MGLTAPPKSQQVGGQWAAVEKLLLASCLGSGEDTALKGSGATQQTQMQAGLRMLLSGREGSGSLVSKEAEAAPLHVLTRHGVLRRQVSCRITKTFSPCSCWARLDGPAPLGRHSPLPPAAISHGPPTPQAPRQTWHSLPVDPALAEGSSKGQSCHNLSARVCGSPMNH